MTYCIAWKTAKMAGIVTDSAATSNVSLREYTGGFTTFGELHEYGEQNVEERSLKIFNLGNNIAATIIGNAREGREFILALKEMLGQGGDTYKAALAVAEKLAPVFGYEIILTYLDENNSPQLCGLGREGIYKVKEGEVIQRGSVTCIPTFPTAVVEDFVRSVSSATPAQQLVLVLGYCQSLGQLNELIKHGVGGIFCGVQTSAEGLHWAPDILYVVYDFENPSGDECRTVATFSRYDCVGAASMSPNKEGYSSKNLVVLNNFDPDYQINSEDRDRVKKFETEFDELRDKSKYDYVIFLGKKNPTLLCIDMNKQSKHSLLKIATGLQEGHGYVELHINHKIKEFHKDPNNSFGFVPFF